MANPSTQNIFSNFISGLESLKVSANTFQIPDPTPSVALTQNNPTLPQATSDSSRNVAAVLPAIQKIFQNVTQAFSNLNPSLTPTTNPPKPKSTLGVSASLSKADVQTMIDRALNGLAIPKTTQEIIYRSSPGSAIGLANAISQSFTSLRNDVSSGALFDPSTISSLTNLTTASTSNFFGAGLSTCQSGNFLTFDGAGHFGCATDSTGSGSSGNKFATSTNQSALYPNGGTNIGLVIGATATVTPSLFEVTGGASIDRSTTTSATTTSLFATTASTTNLFGAGLSTCNGASKGLTYDGQGKFGCTTFSSASSTLLTDSNTFSALTFFSNILLTGSTTLQNFTFVNATGTSATTTNFFTTNASSTNLFYTTAKGGTETLTGTLTANNILANASTTLQNFTFVNATGSSATTTNLFTTNLVATNLTLTSATMTSATSTNFFSTNTSGTNETLTGLQTSGNLLVTGSSTLQNFTGLNSTTTSATTTNIFSSIASSTSLFSTSLTTGLITSGNVNGQTISSAANFTGTLTATAGLTTLSNLLVTGSSTLQNFTFVNATGTQATTTRFAISGITNAILSTNANGSVVASTSIGVNYLTGVLSIANGGTNNSSAYTSGSVVFSNGTSLTQNNSNLFWDNSVTGLGLGTTTPKWTLQVASSTNSQLTLSDAIPADNHWSFRNAGGVLYLATSSPLTYATSSVAVLSINGNSLATFAANLTANGLFTAANTLTSGSSTLQNFTGLNSTTSNATTTTSFATNASSTNLFFTNATGSAQALNVLTVSGTVTFSGLAATTTAGQDVCYGQAAGAIGNITHTNGTSACSASSRRFKQDINPLDDTSGLAEVMALQPVSFKYTNQYLGGFVNDPNWTKQFVGFIAEDVATVDPRLISVDDQGLPVNVQYPNITAILTKAVQEQQKLISDLQTTVSSLGVSVGNVIAHFVQIAADFVSAKKLTVGDPSNLTASGITILDRATGEPNCVYIENGVLRSETGECGVSPAPSVPDNSGPISGSDTGTNTNSGTTTSTTTPPIDASSTTPTDASTTPL